MYFSFLSSIIVVNKFRSDESVDKDEKKRCTYDKKAKCVRNVTPCGQILTCL